MEAPPRCEFEGSELVLRIDRAVRARVDEISPLVDELMEVISEMGCGEGKAFEIETSIREALANAIVHGANGDAEKKIQITVACDEERGMLIVVRDPGPGFDPAKLPSPVVGQSIYSTHGRGIYLINRLMDDVRFERGGTEIHMRLSR